MTSGLELVLAGLVGMIIEALALALMCSLHSSGPGTETTTNDRLLLGFLVLGAFALGVLVAYVVISGML